LPPYEEDEATGVPTPPVDPGESTGPGVDPGLTAEDFLAGKNVCTETVNWFNHLDAGTNSFD
jgi:hypothetical protein